MNIKFEQYLTDRVYDAIIAESDPFPEPTEMSTHGEIMEWLTYNMFVGNGVDCPCCGRITKLYPRKFEGQWIIQLAAIRDAGGVWDSANIMKSIPTNMVESTNGMRRTFQLMRHWGLIVASDDEACTYAITDLGRQFLAGVATIPKYAVLYDNELVFMGGISIYWYEAVNSRFSMDELFDPGTMHSADINGFITRSQSHANPASLLRKDRKAKSSGSTVLKLLRGENVETP